MNHNKKLKLALIEAGMTHWKCARATNALLATDEHLSEHDITRIITGRKKPSAAQAIAIATATGLEKIDPPTQTPSTTTKKMAKSAVMKKIIQIIPAPAHTCVRDISGTTIRQVHAWALIEDTNNPHSGNIVVPMIEHDDYPQLIPVTDSNMDISSTIISTEDPI